MRTAEEISDATVEEITAELDTGRGGDGVWIDPELAEKHGITADQEESLEQAVAEADGDLHVLLIDMGYDDPRFSDASGVAAWIEDDLETSATYVVTGRTSDGHGVEVVDYSNSDDIFVDVVANEQHPNDPVAQALKAIELFGSGEAEEIYYSLQEEDRDPVEDADEDAADPSSLFMFFLTALGVGALIWVANRVQRSRATSKAVAAGRPTANEPRFRLPQRVLRSVREAEDRQVRQRADREALALGEALDAAEITGRSQPVLDAWQAALDHYAAARKVIEEAGSPADVMGALVLAQRGTSALAAAQQGTDWQPDPSCYFHPLHHGPVQQVDWGAPGRAATVPACGPCAAALADGEEPEDVLDFIDGDATTHYYALDIPPWSTTGYGSLDPDLLAALVRTGR